MSLPLLLVAMGAAPVTSTVTAALPQVHLQLAECIPQRGLVEDLVGIELGFSRISPDPAELEVHTVCEVDRLRIFVARDHTWQGPDRPVVVDIAERRIALRDVRAEGGPRLVALNIAELVQDPPPAPPRPPTPVTQAMASPPTPAPGSQLSLGLAPTLRFLGNPDRFVPGARVRVALDAAPGAAWPWSLALWAGFEQSEVAVSPGAVQTRLLSAGLLAGARWDLLSGLSLYSQLGLHGGWVNFDASSSQEGVQTFDGAGPWLGSALALRLRYGRRLGFGLGLEGGWTLYGVFGDAAGTRVALDGAWLGSQLFADWRFETL